MKTIGTVKTVVERQEDIVQKPKYAVGDYLEVYCGRNEGHHFWIADVRFNRDLDTFEYLYGVALLGGWQAENHVSLIKRAGQ